MGGGVSKETCILSGFYKPKRGSLLLILQSYIDAIRKAFFNIYFVGTRVFRTSAWTPSTTGKRYQTLIKFKLLTGGEIPVLITSQKENQQLVRGSNGIRLEKVCGE